MRSNSSPASIALSMDPTDNLPGSRPRLTRAETAVRYRRSVRFTKRDVVRAVEAIRAAGLPIASIRIEPDGAILVIPGTPPPVPCSANPWDSDAS